MASTIDARGLSCPQPVIMTLDEIKKGSEKEIIILVDTETSKENVTRAAQSKGCTIIESTENDEGYKITVSKG